MRITFLLPRYGWQPSGGYAVVYRYARELTKRGHQVTVVHPRRLPPGGWPEPHGVTQRLRRSAARVRDYLLVPTLTWADPDPAVTMLHVPALTARHVPDGDVLIATWWSTVECALQLPPSKGMPFHLVQGLETWGGDEDRVLASWRAPVHKVFVASWLRDHALSLGIDEQHVSLVLNGVDLDVFRPHRAPSGRGPHVAMLYSPESYKGGDFGVDVLQRVHARVPAMTATMFGVAAAPRSLPGWMRYVRSVPQSTLAAEVYSAAAVYFCPSLAEGFHLPNVEAMACGCAVVSSAFAGVTDYAVDGDNALLYSPGDGAAAAAALERVLCDEVLRSRLQQRGLARAASMGWSGSADQLHDVLTSRVAAARA